MDEDEEAEESKENQWKLDTLSKYLPDRRAKMRDLRKGFVFFIELEKKEIKRSIARHKARQLQLSEKARAAEDEAENDDEFRYEWLADQEDKVYMPITDWSLILNEWADLDLAASQTPPPFQPKKIVESSEDGAARSTRVRGEESIEAEESFDWFEKQEHSETTYYSFVNKMRRTIEPGEQIFYCYGNRTNKFLLVNYGFCYHGNGFESFEIPLRYDIFMDDLFSPEIVDLQWASPKTQNVRLKMDQICEVMTAFLRNFCKRVWLNKQQRRDAISGCRTDLDRKIFMSRPTLIAYEKYIMRYYLQICNYIQAQMNKVATLEQDLDMLKRGQPGHPGAPLDFKMRMAVVYRAEKKKILRSQINLV